MDNDIKYFLQIVTGGRDMKITSNYTTKELVDAVENLSDDEMNEILIQRPGHPEMRGFIVNPRMLGEQTAYVAFALSQRQSKLC